MFEPGQHVVVRGKGLGTVVSVGSSILVDELDLKPGEESRFEIPQDRAAEALRPVVGRDSAERVLAIVRERTARPTEDRALAYRRALKSGELEAQARLLAASYGGPRETPELQYQERLEKSVFGELAIALGTTRKVLAAKTRSAVLGEAPSRALSLPDMSREVAFAKVPDLKGLVPIGAFAVHERIACGEVRADASVDAVPGIWFAYASVNEEDEDIDELVAIHADHVGQLRELERGVRTIGKLPIEGAHVAIFDEAMADDVELFEAVAQAGREILEDRCAAVGLAGDGHGAMRVSPAGRAAYVRIDLQCGW